jgi:hypothetical protein
MIVKNFVCFAIHNETFWCNECVHILALGQMTIFHLLFYLDENYVILLPFVSSIVMGKSIMLCMDLNLYQE